MHLDRFGRSSSCLILACAMLVYTDLTVTFWLFPPPHKQMTQLVKIWFAAHLILLALPAPEPLHWVTRNTIISSNWHYSLYNDIFHGIIWSLMGAFIIYSTWAGKQWIQLYHYMVRMSISIHPQKFIANITPVDTLNRVISGLYICRLIAGPVKPPHLTNCYVGHWSLQLATATWCQHLVSGLWQRSWASCPSCRTPVSLTPSIHTHTHQVLWRVQREIHRGSQKNERSKPRLTKTHA